MQVSVLKDSKRKTRTMTFRIDLNIESALAQESRRLGTSLNSLVNHVLERYVASGSLSDQLDLVPVSKDLLRELFGLADKKTISQIGARLAETSGREHILFLFQQLNLSTVLRYLDIWRSYYDGSQHRQEGKTHFFTVRHDVNINFSTFIKEYVTTMIQNTVPRQVRFETVAPNSVTFSFDET